MKAYRLIVLLFGFLFLIAACSSKLIPKPFSQRGKRAIFPPLPEGEWSNIFPPEGEGSNISLLPEGEGRVRAHC